MRSLLGGVTPINNKAKNKTIETQTSVADFLTAIKEETRRNDCSTIIHKTK